MNLESQATVGSSGFSWSGFDSSGVEVPVGSSELDCSASSASLFFSTPYELCIDLKNVACII